MAKIVNAQTEFIKDTIVQREEENYSSYSRFLENAPLFVTYYKQNEIESMSDRGYENVHSRIGKDSPIRYNKITDIPLYNVDKASLDLDMGDTGISASFQTEGTLPPGLFEPIPDDYMLIDYMSKTLLFRITDVSVDNIKSNKYFKISFKFEQFDLDDLEMCVIDSFHTLYENIGTESKAIIRDTDYEKIETLKTLFKDVKTKYLNKFYKPELNSIVVKDVDSDAFLYDPLLTKFIIDNELFYEQQSFKCINLLIETVEDMDFDERYRSSIFTMIETCEGFDFENVYAKFPIQSLSSTFYRRPDTYYEMKLKFSCECESSYYANGYLDYPYLYDDIQNNVNLPYSNCDKMLIPYNIIIKYINKDSKLTDIIIEQLNNYYIKYDKDNMITVPIILYIILKIINNILIKDFEGGF